MSAGSRRWRLVFALEDEVRESLQGAGVFGEARTVEAGFGADGVFESEVARAVEGAGIADQGNEGFRLHGVKFFFFQDAGDHFAGFAVAVLHGVDQGKRDFAFLQIAEDRLPELFAGSCEIQKIIHQLEGKAGIPAVFGEGVFVFFIEAAENAPQTRATAEEAGGLEGGKSKCVFFGDVNAADFLQLQQFAFNHFLSQINEDIEHVEIAFLERDLEGLHVQPIAGEDAAMIAPAGVGGGPAAARVRAINHIVVNQSRAVEKFDDGGKLNGALRVAIAAGGVTVGQQQQRGAQTLPSPAEEIAGDFGNGLIGGGTLAREFLFDLHQVFAHQFKNLFDGQ